MPDQRTDYVKALIPMLVCVDAASEIDFCKTALGAVELSRRSDPDRNVVHATLAIGEAIVMVHREFPATQWIRNRAWPATEFW